jgi:hypothetical protein
MISASLGVLLAGAPAVEPPFAAAVTHSMEEFSRDRRQHRRRDASPARLAQP